MLDARHYSATDTLRNGTPILIRSVRPDDRKRLIAAFEKLDPQSIYTRFFTYKDELTDEDLRSVTEVDFDMRVVLLVTKGSGESETVIGVGSYSAYETANGGRAAEVAFIVEEDYQGQGIAGRLVRHLAEIARANGIGQFEAEVLPENRAMTAVFARSGLPMRERREDGVIRVTMELTGEDNPR